jgi:WD40 repeat protein/energy-coupling factor transporter ATP-binding protein EcfA2
VKKVKAPYVGIRPFEKDDWPIFFGRESLSNQLLYKLETNRFVAVVGSSGSGKSSVVKAGLLPLLEDHRVMRRAETWLTLICRPADDPCGGLARRLVAANRRIKGVSETEQVSISVDLIRAMLRTSDRGIIPVLEQFDLPTSTHILVVVDQFEELFGFREAGASDPRAPEEAERFVACLLDSCKEPIQPISSNLTASLAQRIWVVLTMRSDFIGDCEIFPALSKKVSESQFLVPILDPEQKRKAIIRPSLADSIEAADYRPFTFDDGLVSIIVNESGTRIDQLPLMQHALMRTWASAVRRADEAHVQGITLTETDYDSIGRIDNALSQHADAAFAELTNDDTDGRNAAIARRLFLLLCDVSPEGKITRRRPTVGEVMEVAQASLEEVKSVVEAFQRDHRNFILTRPSGEEFTAGTRLDVSHEALLRQWSMFNCGEVSRESPPALEGNGEKSQLNRLWISIKKWLLIQTGHQRTPDHQRAPRGWLAEERDAAAELLRLRQDCELHAQGRGDLLDMIALTRVEEWQQSTRPSEAWARRYLDGKGTWKKIEEFISQSNADVTMARRVAWGSLILITLTLATVTMVAISMAGISKAHAAKVTELREPWDQLHDQQLEEADKKLRNSVTGKVDAMRHFINALRANPGSVEAARFICRSLAQESWFRPLTPSIMAPADTSLLCAAIGPNKKIYAVSRSGYLLAQKENQAAFEPMQALMPSLIVEAKDVLSNDQVTPDARPEKFVRVSTVNDTKPPSSDSLSSPKTVRSAPTVALQAASFSNDGTRVAIVHAVSNEHDKGPTLEVWKWSQTNYVRVAVGNVPDWSSFRMTWSPDGQGFILSRWSSPRCILYRLEGQDYDCQLRRTDFPPVSIQATAFSPDGKMIAAVVADHPNEIAMFDAYTGEHLAQKTIRLAKPLSTKVNQILFGPGLNELTFAADSSAEIINLQTGRISRAVRTGTDERITRMALSSPMSNGDRRIALIAGGRIHAYSVANLDQRIGEPIKLKGPVGFASFETGGARLLTWSGLWGSFNAVRLWSVEPVAAIDWEDGNLNDPDKVLRWLPDLAEAVTGHGETADGDADLFPDVPTLEDFAKKYDTERLPFPYAELWARFLEPKRPRN